MRLIQYQIDAFTDHVFSGNPAAVILLESAISETLMQSIAMENNLSETAFLSPHTDGDDAYYLRWFTPDTEIEFCGHATIAAAHALAAHIDYPNKLKKRYHFHTQIGGLSVDVTASQTGNNYALTAPVATARDTPVDAAIRQAFPIEIEAAFKAGHNLYIVAKSAREVARFKPDFTKMLPLSDHGIGLTAQGGPDKGGKADCTSRFFVPAIGINEDPVTGSAHAAIGPYWGQRLGKTHLKAYQASRRGGWIDIEIKAPKVTLSGPAVTFCKSEISLPD